MFLRVRPKLLQLLFFFNNFCNLCIVPFLFISFLPGLKKKLLKLAKRSKSFAVVGNWVRSIINHLYWCISTSGGDVELVEAKCLSILNHMQNKHRGHNKSIPKVDGRKICTMLGVLELVRVSH